MKTRVVPTKVHAAIDYATAPTLMLAPELFRMKDGKSASLPPRIAGMGGAAYSALSDHELAAKRVLPMKAHLALDAAAGVAIAALPWLGGSARKGTRYWLPQALVGTKELALALTTQTKPKSRWSRLTDVAVGRKSLGGAVAVAALVGGGVYALVRLTGGGDEEPAAA